MYVGTEDYLGRLEGGLREHGDPERAQGQKSYMKEKFQFFGLRAPERRELTRDLLRKNELPPMEDLRTITESLWDRPEREYQYFGVELLERYVHHEDSLSMYEYIIVNKSWWDTVDRIAKNLVGGYFQMYPQQREAYIGKWLNSGNIWLQRTCLLFQLGYKEDTDVDMLFDVILELKDKNEFFIQKAIGWSLREYSKVDPGMVESFIKREKLSPLATREGMKVIGRASNRSRVTE